MPDFSQIWDLLFLISVGQDNRSVSPPYQGTGCFRIKPEYFPLPQERVSHIFFQFLCFMITLLRTVTIPVDHLVRIVKIKILFFQYSCQEIRHILCGHFQPKPQKKKQFLFLQMPDSASYFTSADNLVEVGFMDLGV